MAAIAAEVVRVDNITAIIASLIDPAKFDTLKCDRTANIRLSKVSHWLEIARLKGDDLGRLTGNAQAHVGYAGTVRTREDKRALLRHLTILQRLGCLTADGMDKLRKGNAPTMTEDIAEVDQSEGDEGV